LDDADEALQHWATMRVLNPTAVARGVITRAAPGLLPLVVAAWQAYDDGVQVDEGGFAGADRYDYGGKRVNQTVASDARHE
jgi:hypothetical protein